jgi:hypothetical protein
MKRSSIVPAAIALAAVAACVLTWFLFARSEGDRYARTRTVLRSPSVVRLALTVRRERGPLLEEDYRMADIDGLSSASYRVVGRNGAVIELKSLPRTTYDVTFFFEKTVSDGVWDLPDKPPRGDLSVSYVISVAQTVNGAHGAHAFHFTDPHYWAVTGGRQYHIRLEPGKATPDLLHLESTSIAEPRYRRLVDDFQAFGSAAFRAQIAAARAKVLAKHSGAH